MKRIFRHIYGPVYSWRLGESLGVDPLSQVKKICNMDCIYCQLGRTAELTSNRSSYVTVSEIMEEIQQVSLKDIDYITFSGRGEPTLASNLGEMIDVVKALTHHKVAVVTNSVLIYLQDVRHDLSKADFVLAKLDAGNQQVFDEINVNTKISFREVVSGLKAFRHDYKGKLALQIMIMSQNLDKLKDIADIARSIRADEIELNTPLRACSVQPIDSAQMQEVKKIFSGMPVVTVFDAPFKESEAMDDRATSIRHGRTRKSLLR